jgi:hypothetical protein
VLKAMPEKDFNHKPLMVSGKERCRIQTM